MGHPIVTEKNHNGHSGGPLDSVICQGCGKRARELVQDDARKLRQHFIEAVPVTARAFECVQCEVIIYEDEFVLGEFVPTQFRNLSEQQPPIAPIADWEDFLPQMEPVIAVNQLIAGR
jgi:hypothetical protein